MPPALPLAIYDFAIALFIGALVGLEREKRKSDDGDAGLGGIRTFILIAMAGAVAAWLSTQLEAPYIFAAGLALVAALVLAGHVVAVQGGHGGPGLTTEIAAVVVYLLGGAVLFGFQALAVGLGIVTSATLAFKQPLHGAVKRIGEEDIYAALKLLIATFIVLPLLPNRVVDPFGALNPSRLWLLVILISTLSLVGYVAVRILGQARGTAVTGLAGGMVSSTAVTLAFSRQSREQRMDPSVGDALAAGILLAWVMMFVRIGVEVAVVYPPILAELAVPFTLMGVLCLAAGVFYLRRGGRASERAAAESDVPLTNPFRLTSAMRFAAFFALVLVVVKVVEQNFPGEGLYVVAAVAGLTDVDAITLSMANFARTGGEERVAVNAITIAAMTNTLVKSVLVVVLGVSALRVRVARAAAVVIVGGAVALLLL
jgi:uncharacterized membrane protein (DUF4010 family)